MRQPTRLLTFMGSHALAGALGALVILTAILVTDIGHLGTLVFGGGKIEWVALSLLASGMVVTFSSVAMAVGVFSLAQGPQRVLTAEDEAELAADGRAPTGPGRHRRQDGADRPGASCVRMDADKRL